MQAVVAHSGEGERSAALRFQPDDFSRSTSSGKRRNSARSLNVFVFLAELRTLYQHKISLFDILGMRLNNQHIFWCV